ncbi:hypothetical protein [Bacillus gobiensis]|uniref:hypothetical protein n=1 Tax=Bacillus gobiensis TaxID=1441095 RepID=UPI003D1BA971
MPKHIEILHTVLATKNQAITVKELSERYGEHPEDIAALAERNKDLRVSNGVVMAKREKALAAAFTGAAVVLLIGIVVVLPGLTG